MIVKSGELEGRAQVVDLKDYERALVWIDGRFSHVLPPGLSAYWTAFRDVRVEVVDTIGAGDAFTAGLVVSVLEGRSVAEAARFASRLAAREARREALLKVEGKLRIERSSELFRVAAKLASERRLSRFLYHARRPA